MINRSILLVDDEKLLRWGLKVNLEKKGFSVMEATSSEQALTILGKERIAILLTDYIMDGMNGDDLVRLVREKDKQLKIIMFSGFQLQGGTYQEMKSKTDLIIKKPVELDLLVRSIDKLLLKR